MTIKWLIYLILLTITAMVQMFFSAQMQSPSATGEYLFLLAFYVSLGCPHRSIIALFFFAGVFRDIFITQHLGPATLLFTICGIIFSTLRDKISGEHFLSRFLLLFVFLLTVLTLLTVFDMRFFSFPLFCSVLANVVYTLFLGPLVKLLLELTPLSSWQNLRRGVL